MNCAIILAAGQSHRITTQTIPKQFIKVKDLPLICHSINAFNDLPDINKIIVVINNEWQQHLVTIFKEHKINTDKIQVVIGGHSRNQSLCNAIKYLDTTNTCQANDVILTHDAARPFISQDIITANINSCRLHKACNTAIKCIDTVFNSTDHVLINEIPNRDEMYASQTPQTFTWEILKQVYLNMTFDQQLFDHVDASTLVLKAGFKIYIVNGHQNNFKITTDEDLNKIHFMLNIDKK